MQQSARVARITGWISVLPLVGLPVIALTGAPAWLTTLLVGWGSLLLAFWAGNLWMRHLGDDPQRPWLLAAALALALAAWPAIVLPLHWAMFWLAALYAIYLFIDEPWRAQGRSAWHRRMRLMLTVLAITVLVASGLIHVAGNG